MSQFYKIVKNFAPRYLNELLPKLSSERTHFRLRSRGHFTQLLCRTSTLQKSFFPSAINGRNSRDLDVRNSVSHFKAKLGQFSFRILTIGYMILHCLRYAAQRHVLLTSATNILGETCSSSSDARKLNFLLYGVWSVNCNVNRAFFFAKHKSLVINTNRFSEAIV